MKRNLSQIVMLLFAAASAATRADADDLAARDEARAQAQDALKQLADAQAENATVRAQLAADESKLAAMPDLGEPLTAEQLQQVNDFIDSLHSADASALPAPMPVIEPPAADTAAPQS